MCSLQDTPPTGNRTGRCVMRSKLYNVRQLQYINQIIQPQPDYINLLRRCSSMAHIKMQRFRSASYVHRARGVQGASSVMLFPYRIDRLPASVTIFNVTVFDAKREFRMFGKPAGASSQVIPHSNEPLEICKPQTHTVTQLLPPINP